MKYCWVNIKEDNLEIWVFKKYGIIFSSTEGNFFPYSLTYFTRKILFKKPMRKTLEDIWFFLYN